MFLLSTVLLCISAYVVVATSLVGCLLQDYQQAPAYAYRWPPQQPAYDAAQVHVAQPDDSNPPVPGTETQSAVEQPAGVPQVFIIRQTLGTCCPGICLWTGIKAVG